MGEDLDLSSRRYRLDVIAPTVVDAVRFVGGWLFDRAKGGWDVSVFVADADEARPLRILGAEVGDLDWRLEGPRRSPAALSVAAELYATDERVRQVVCSALRSRAPEITVWGAGPSLDLSRKTVVTHHGLSAAARTYKAHALTAAHIRVAAVEPTEVLGRLRSNPRVAGDNLPGQADLTIGQAVSPLLPTRG